MAMGGMGLRNSKKATKGVSLGLRFVVEYSLSWGPKRGNIGLGLGANPIRVLWTWA